MKTGITMEPPPGVAARIDSIEQLASLLERAGVFVISYDVATHCCRSAEITFAFSPTAGSRAMKVARANGYQVVRLAKAWDCGVEGDSGLPYWAMDVELG